MITAEFINIEKDDWKQVDSQRLGQQSPVVSQRRTVGICRDKSKFLTLEIHAYDQCVCFESIKVLGDIVIIGFGESVHFFDVSNSTVISRKMDGYFGYLYTPEDFSLQKNSFQLLAASASHIHHFTNEGEEIWKSPELGIDGVIINEVTSSKIRASGEWDPPGGWENAEINLDDGKAVIV